MVKRERENCQQKEKIMAPKVHAIPPFDELIQCPEKIQSLPREVAFYFLTVLSGIQASLVARIGLGNTDPHEREEQDSLLTVQGASMRLQTTPDWLYRNANKLPFTVRNGRQLRFSSKGIDRYIRERQGLT